MGRVMQLASRPDLVSRSSPLCILKPPCALISWDLKVGPSLLLFPGLKTSGTAVQITGIHLDWVYMPLKPQEKDFAVLTLGMEGR